MWEYGHHFYCSGSWMHLEVNLLAFLQVHLFPSMSAYGHHFRTNDADDGCVTLDHGLEVEFEKSSHSNDPDQNLIERKLGYIRKIQEIMQVEFSSFNVLFLGASGGIY
jgi:hypothetical protein